MTPAQQQEKLTQFTEFFTIEHSFSVNIEPLTAEQQYDQQSFEALIPLPFKLASDNAVIDQQALRPIQNLSSSASQLVEYLHHQANKIDLLVNYILSQHDEADKRFQGINIGGGGFTFVTDNTFDLGQKITAKLFLLEENCAVYCHGEIIEQAQNNDGSYQYKVLFYRIREDDREVLVRTSLHLQAKQLKQLAKARHQAAQAQST